MNDMELADVLANCPFHTEAGSPAIYRKVPEVIAGRIIAALRRAALAQTEIKGHMRVEDDLRIELEREKDDFFKAQARIAELEKAGAEMVDWLDSKEVKDTFEQSAALTLTHPHLGIRIEPQFSRWAGEVIQRFRDALKSRP